MNNNVQIMVAGSDGYIGFPLVLRLLKRGYTIVGLDNGLRRKMVKELNSESATRIDFLDERVINLKNIGDFSFYNIDVANQPESLDYIICRHRPDIIVNLAHQPAGPEVTGSPDTYVNE